MLDPKPVWRVSQKRLNNKTLNREEYNTEIDRSKIEQQWPTAAGPVVTVVSPAPDAARQRISLPLHGTLPKCIVGASVLSAPWPAAKSRESFNF